MPSPMRCYTPKLMLGLLMRLQRSLEDKFGGLPWGLPASRWPACAGCGKPQTMLAQLQHHEERLDLGRQGRVLFIFQCNHNPAGCPTWLGDSGANACFVLEPEELSDGLTDTPTFETTIEVEARVLEWIPRDEQPACSGTKIGGAPVWLQSGDEVPPGDWRFAVQIDACHEFEGAPPPAEELGSTITRNVGGQYLHEDPWIRKRGAPPWVCVRDGSWICDAANFGDMGRGYVFLAPGEGRPRGWFFWQC